MLQQHVALIFIWVEKGGEVCHSADVGSRVAPPTNIEPRPPTPGGQRVEPHVFMGSIIRGGWGQCANGIPN